MVTCLHVTHAAGGCCQPALGVVIEAGTRRHIDVAEYNTADDDDPLCNSKFRFTGVHSGTALDPTPYDIPLHSCHTGVLSA
jgi:hypothetical protein